MRHNTLSTLKSLVATAMIALFTLSAAAQDTGSAYSRLGYGLLRNNATSMQRQMGSVGYAMRSGRQINVLNPASYAAIDSMTFLFDMGIDFSSTSMAEGSVKENRLGGGLDYITMQFPLGKYMGGSVGLVPFSSVGYSFGKELEGARPCVRATAASTSSISACRAALQRLHHRRQHKLSVRFDHP